MLKVGSQQIENIIKTLRNCRLSFFGSFLIYNKMEDIETLQKILIEYKYSKKQLKRNVLRFFYKKHPNGIFGNWFYPHVEREINIAILDLEMLFYQAENEILMRDGYINGKISLNITNITKGKYKNRFYFSDLLKIKEELL